MPLVSISIVTYNGEKWISQCLKSVRKQSYQSWQVLIIDNSSRDETVNLAKQVLPKAKLILNKKNLGFAAGHNLGISQSKGDYVLCLNQDVVLHPDFINQAVAVMESDSKIGAVQGKLYKLQNCQWALVGESMMDSRRSLSRAATRGGNDKLTIDTTGLVIFKNRRVINRGQGEIEQGQYDKQEEIFGADGAAPVYRRTALESVVLPPVGEYFDQDFFAYKEDIDLSWRLRLAGWQIIYQPKAIAWHGRGAGTQAAITGRHILKQHQQTSRFCSQLSWKNQRLMQIKNESPALLLQHLFPIIWKEIKTAGYICLREPSMLKSVAQFIKQAPRAWQKRKAVMAKKNITTQEMKKWFV